MLAANPERDRAAIRRRRARAARRSAGWVVLAAGLWLAIRWGAGAGAADYAAGFASGAAVCGGLVLTARGRADRWARRAGVAARAAVDRPVPRVPKPARTPIHDEAAARQRKGA